MRAVADISRRTLIDTELEALLQPYPGWETEWIHLGPGPTSLQGVRVACGSGTFTAVHTSSAGILRGTTASAKRRTDREPVQPAPVRAVTRTRSAVTTA